MTRELMQRWVKDECAEIRKHWRQKNIDSKVNLVNEGQTDSRERKINWMKRVCVIHYRTWDHWVSQEHSGWLRGTPDTVYLLIAFDFYVYFFSLRFFFFFFYTFMGCFYYFICDYSEFLSLSLYLFCNGASLFGNILSTLRYLFEEKIHAWWRIRMQTRHFQRFLLFSESLNHQVLLFVPFLCPPRNVQVIISRGRGETTRGERRHSPNPRG